MEVKIFLKYPNRLKQYSGCNTMKLTYRPGIGSSKATGHKQDGKTWLHRILSARVRDFSQYESPWQSSLQRC